MSAPDREFTVALAPHPATPCGVVERIDVRVIRTADGWLTLCYTAEGDWQQVRLDAPGIPRRGEALWRHTCFELFVAPVPGTAYQELNVAPSLAWASYHFSAYRSDLTIRSAEPTPTLSVERRERRLILSAAVHLPTLARGGVARLALAAVIEPVSGGLCYWALRHAPGAPDFHHVDNFAAQI